MDPVRIRQKRARRRGPIVPVVARRRRPTAVTPLRRRVRPVRVPALIGLPVSPVPRRDGAAARDVLPLRLARQSVLLPGPPRQPPHVCLRFLPVHAHHRFRVGLQESGRAPTHAVDVAETAVDHDPAVEAGRLPARGHVALVLPPRHLVHADRERSRDRHPTPRPFVLVLPLLRRRRSHQEAPRRHHHQLGTLLAIPKRAPRWHHRLRGAVLSRRLASGGRRRLQRRPLGKRAGLRARHHRLGRTRQGGSPPPPVRPPRRQSHVPAQVLVRLPRRHPPVPIGVTASVQRVQQVVREQPVPRLFVPRRHFRPGRRRQHRHLRRRLHRRVRQRRLRPHRHPGVAVPGEPGLQVHHYRARLFQLRQIPEQQVQRIPGQFRPVRGPRRSAAGTRARRLPARHARSSTPPRPNRPPGPGSSTVRLRGCARCRTPTPSPPGRRR